MRTGLFCTYENPRQDYRSAYAEQTELVRMVEGLGFDEAWVAEHHFNPQAASPSLLAVLAHLAAHTARIRLGSAAVLLPFRDPILVAEEAATIDILSGGRFDFGVAKGGPFPAQNKHFAVSPDVSRARTCEALALIQKLLYEDVVSFEGSFFKADGVELVPKPVQQPIPTFFATSTADTVQLAAECGYGLMAGPPFPLDHLRRSLQLYRDMAPTTDARLVIIRFFHLGPTREQAVAEAQAMLAPFIERMRGATARMQPAWTPWMAMDRMIDDSLIGTEDDVRAKIETLERELAPRSLILKPLSPDLGKRKADLQAFAERLKTATA